MLFELPPLWPPIPGAFANWADPSREELLNYFHYVILRQTSRFGFGDSQSNLIANDLMKSLVAQAATGNECATSVWNWMMDRARTVMREQGLRTGMPTAQFDNGNAAVDQFKKIWDTEIFECLLDLARHRVAQ